MGLRPLDSLAHIDEQTGQFNVHLLVMYIGRQITLYLKIFEKFVRKYFLQSLFKDSTSVFLQRLGPCSCACFLKAF